MASGLPGSSHEVRLVIAPETRVEIDRPRFSLRVYRWNQKTARYRRILSFRVAIGAIGHSTPPGPYRIGSRSRTPDWRAPDADWVLPSKRGKTFEFGDPENPFDGGFISLVGHPSTKGDGVGIHGTKFDPQLGTRASHGCIRMAVPDLLKLWDIVPMGAQVTVYGDQ